MFATLPRLVVSLPSLFTMRPPVSLNSASVFHIVVCIVLGISKPGFGEDGHLFCRKKWIDGVSVTLTCEVDKGSIETKCFEQQNSTIFNRDGSPQCEVGAAGYAECPLVTDSTNPSAACWCEQNETYYFFKYRLKANRLEDDGLWTCQKGCFDNSLVVNPLNITADTSCHASVEESACTSMTCAGPGVCKLNTNTNEGQCVCPHERLKADCGECDFFSLKNGCRKWDAVVLIFFLLILVCLLAVLLAYLFVYQKTSNLPVQHNHKTEEQLKNLIEKLRSACDQIMKELGGYPKIVIEVTQSPLEDPSYVIISGKNYFVLSKAKKKVLSKIEELKKSCNPGTGSSHQATDARTQEERKRSGHGDIELSRLRENSLSRDSSADGMMQVDTPKGNRPLPQPRQENISTNIIGQRLPPLESTVPKMVSVERNSYVEDQKQLPKPNTKLAPIQSSKNN